MFSIIIVSHKMYAEARMEFDYLAYFWMGLWLVFIGFWDKPRMTVGVNDVIGVMR